MKKSILYILICMIVCMPFLTGCRDVNIYSAHSEPEDLVVIKTIGIDYENGVVKVTAAAGTTSDGKKPEIYTSSASTLAEAINGIQNGYMGKEAYFSHTENVLIGEEAAKNGLSQYLDYIGRNVYMRLSAGLFIVQGNTAQRLMEDTTGENTASSEMLEAISKKSEYMASGKVFTCQEIMSGLAENGSALVYAVEKGDQMQAGADETASIKPVGYALIKDGYLEEYLETGVTEGAGMIMGHTKSGMLTVDVEGHGSVTLKITDIKTKYEPSYADGEMTAVMIKISVKMNIEESAEDLNFINESMRKKIENAASEEIKDTVELAINKSKEFGSDFLGMGDEININDPYKFRKTYENWEEKFPEIKINFEIESELKRTYDMENSLSFRGEGKNDK